MCTPVKGYGPTAKVVWFQPNIDSLVVTATIIITPTSTPRRRAVPTVTERHAYY